MGHNILKHYIYAAAIVTSLVQNAYALDHPGITADTVLHSGEWKSVADDYSRLEKDALRQFISLPAEKRDAYRQLILFPVQAMYDMYHSQAMNVALSSDGIHTLTLTPIESGTVFEKVIIDFGGYKPSYLFGKESKVKRGL